MLAVFVGVGTGVSVGWVSVGIGVLVLVTVGTRVGVRVGIRVGVLVGVRVRVGISVAVNVGGELRGSRVWVGGNKNEYKENGVAVPEDEDEETTRRVTTSVGVGTGPGVEFPVTGMTMGLGANSTTIWSARAAAVLFILAKDSSSVLRDRRSSALGGAGLKLAMIKIIQNIPPQIPSAAKACNGKANFLNTLRIVLRAGCSHD